jgi:hypothetical protein
MTALETLLTRALLALGLTIFSVGLIVLRFPPEHFPIHRRLNTEAPRLRPEQTPRLIE